MDAPRDLTLPASSATTRAILSAALKRLLRDLRALRVALGPIGSVLERALRSEPGAVFTALRRPSVGTTIRVLREAPDEALARRLRATLAAELMVAGVSLPPMTLERIPDVVCLGGRRVLPGGDVSIEGRRFGAVELGAPSTEVGPFHAIRGSIVLSTVDDNPLAMNEAHPDKRGNAVDLGDASATAWVDALRDALDRVARYLPVIREEADLALAQIVPVGTDDEKHLSASYREALGTIYLSLHPDPMTMTEAVIHELSHTKLNALLETGPLLENAFSPLFTSPVRPDPRPLHGVLLAVHAFLPVEALYARMADAEDPLAGTPAFARRRAQVIAKNRAGADVLLANARPTTLGAGLLDEMKSLSPRA